MSLSEKTVLVTRPLDQSAELVREIESRGGSAVVIPMIVIEPTDSWESCDRALAVLEKFDALLFTSTNAVRFFYERLTQQRKDADALGKKAVFAVGEKTRGALERLGIQVTAVPEHYSATGLGETLSSDVVSGKKILFPRGDLGGEGLVRLLRARGASVEIVQVYRTVPPENVDGNLLGRRIVNGEFDAAAFASPSAVRNFVRLLPADILQRLAECTIVVVIGPSTEKEARGLGLRVDLVAREATAAGLAGAIAEYFGRS